MGKGSRDPRCIRVRSRLPGHLLWAHLWWWAAQQKLPDVQASRISFTSPSVSYLWCVTLCFPHCRPWHRTNISWAISRVFSCVLWLIQEWVGQTSLLSRCLSSKMVKQMRNNYYRSIWQFCSRGMMARVTKFLNSRWIKGIDKYTSVNRYVTFQT